MSDHHQQAEATIEIPVIQGAPPRVVDQRVLYPSRALQVTFFEDRAEVRRRAIVPIQQPGPQWIALDGVTPLLQDKSLQASVLAGPEALILGVRARRRLASTGEASVESLEALEEALRQRQQDVEALRTEQAHLQLHTERLEALQQDWCAGFGHASGLLSPEQSQGWAQAWDELTQKLTALEERRASLEERMVQARQEQSLAQRHLEVARGEGHKRMELFVEVQVDPRDSGELTLELRYRTPCALWRPEHRASLLSVEPGQSPRVEVVTFATAWQRTGEDWSGVEALFSTARPASAASPPHLSDDVLHLRGKTREERQHIMVEAREQDIQVAGLEGRGGASEIPGVDDGGQPQVFSPRGFVAIPSDGEPHRVEVARHSFDAQLQRVLMPERSQVAHLRARWTWGATQPLLAGPVQLVRRGSFVGLGQLDFTGPGEVAELGFGADDGLRVRRRVIKREEQKSLTGARRYERTVEVFLSNLSDKPRQVRVTERIPVSEVDAVQIKLKESSGWEHDARDGFLHLELSVGPGQTARRHLKYEIQASSNVTLPF